MILAKVLSLLEFYSVFYKEKQGSKYINMVKKKAKQKICLW